MIRTRIIPRLKSPIFICAWPGMGEVAIRAALHLKASLEFKEFAMMSASEFFEVPGIVVNNAILDIPALDGGRFYYYKDPLRRRDIILFIARSQPIAGRSFIYGEEIIKFIERFKVKTIITFAAMSVPIDHTQDSKVWIAVSNRKLLDGFRGYNLKILKDGQISGMNGLILGIGKLKGMEGICLLGEIPLYAIQIENPKASLAVLEVLSRYLNLTIELSFLRERARFVQEEINKLLGYLKGDYKEPRPLSDDEIERIKKELSAYTKLPESARKKIEELFKQATLDISKATELKKELDHWHVFEDYQDRFLDLFRKKKTDH